MQEQCQDLARRILDPLLTDRKASGQTGQADRQTGAELDEAGVEGHRRFHCSLASAPGVSEAFFKTNNLH